MKNGQGMFIVYEGNQINHNEILIQMVKMKPFNCEMIANGKGSGLLFAKLVNKHDLKKYGRDPYYHPEYGTITVSGYNQDELSKFCNYTPIESKCGMASGSSRLFNYAYEKYKDNIFSVFDFYGFHFCSVIYDSKYDLLIAGVSCPSNKCNHLYYGYTAVAREMMFSNSYKLLKSFCKTVYEMEDNTYLINGQMPTTFFNYFTITNEQLGVIEKTNTTTNRDNQSVDGGTSLEMKTKKRCRSIIRKNQD